MAMSSVWSCLADIPYNWSGVTKGTASHQTVDFEFGELLAHLEDGERPLSTIAATIFTGRIPFNLGTDAEELSVARCIAADRGFPPPDSRSPLLVVMTDRRLLIGQSKRGLRSGGGLQRVLGEVPLDRIVGIEPRKVGRDGPSARWYNRLGFLCMAALWVLARPADAVKEGWTDLVLDVLVGVVILVGWFAFMAWAIVDYAAKSFVVETKLSGGKSILLQLYGDTDSFLSAFRSVGNRR
jgi:hypothetical protein